MKSARINFGIGAESEYVLEVDDTGAATRCFNPVTGQELGVGGSDLPDVTAADAGKVLAVNASGEWAAEQYAGWDVVLRASTQNFESATYEFIKGSFDVMHGLLARETPFPVRGLMCFPGNEGDGWEAAGSAVILTAELANYGDEVSISIFSPINEGYVFFTVTENGIVYE